MKTITLISVAVAIALSAQARAETITYTGSFSGLTDTDNQLISVSQFNSSLGTLQSATFTLGATMTTSASATNDGNFKVYWNAESYSLSLTGAGPYASLSVAASQPTVFVGTGWANASTGLLSGNQYQVVNVASSTPYLGTEQSLDQSKVVGGNLVHAYNWTYTPTPLSVAQSFSAGAQAAFIGSGNLNFYLNTNNWDTFAVSGAQTGGYPDSTMSLSTNVVSQVSVTYTYAAAAPVPEPESHALLIAGLGLLGAVARRQNKSA